MLGFIGQRLQEPSTHAALAAFLTAVPALIPAIPPQYAGLAAAVFALLGAFLPEAKPAAS